MVPPFWTRGYLTIIWSCGARRRSLPAEVKFSMDLDEQFNKYRLAQELKAMRENAGLSQKELAERVHTKQPSIARMERARVLPKLDLLQRVARALGARL